MRLNADGVPGIRIEIGDERFNSIRAFSGVGAATAKGGDGLDVPFEWPRTDIGELAGQTVRFRFIFKRGEGIEPRLFAAYLSAEHKER